MLSWSTQSIVIAAFINLYKDTVYSRTIKLLSYKLLKGAFKEVSVLSPGSALFCSVVILPPCQSFHWPVGDWMALLASDMQIKGLDINSNCTEVQVKLKT